FSKVRHKCAPIGSRSASVNEICQTAVALLERIQAQRAAKQFVPQPHPVSVDHVGLAVVGDLLDLTLVVVTLHLATIEPLRLPGEAHDPADLVKSGLPLWTERRKDITQVDCILTVSVEVGTRRKPRRGDPVDHCSVAQYG